MLPMVSKLFWSICVIYFPVLLWNRTNFFLLQYIVEHLSYMHFLFVWNNSPTVPGDKKGLEYILFLCVAQFNNPGAVSTVTNVSSLMEKPVSVPVFKATLTRSLKHGPTVGGRLFLSPMARKGTFLKCVKASEPTSAATSDGEYLSTVSFMIWLLSQVLLLTINHILLLTYLYFFAHLTEPLLK